MATPYELQIQFWWTYDIFNSIARPCVPLFVMLSGYLLLQPSKAQEPLRVFFKKRWARIGLPFCFWTIIYIIWETMFNGGSLTFESIQRSILQGPYITFWFLYMLAGLYLLTPLLRVFTAYANDNLKKFVLAVWFVGTGLAPLAGLLGFSVSSLLFILPGWIGYYLLGAYLAKIKVSSNRWRLALVGIMVGGYAWTILASAFMRVNPGPQENFFYDYLTANVMVSSAALFMLLMSIPAKAIENKPTPLRRLIQIISGNTLPIYLLHMILLQAFQKGLFSFTLNTTTLDPIIMMPLLTVLLLFLSIIIIVPLKKIPIVKRLIG